MSLQKNKRIYSVDALRGFAIMGIMLLHSIEHFNFYKFPKKSTLPDWLNTLDKSIWDSLFFLFGGKGYAIFAILFGFTFFLMYTKQQKLKIDFGYRFLWRMLLLACFAFFNGLFFPGEVLLLYSIVGVTLFLVRKFSDKALLFTSIILLLQPIEWGKFIHYLIDNNYMVSNLKMGNIWQALKKGQLSDSFFTLIKTNIIYGHKVGLWWAYDVGRLIQSAGLFIFGYWIGRKGFFIESKESIKYWKKVLLISIICFTPLYFLEINFKSIVDLKIYKKTIFKAIDMYANLAFTLILVSSFLLLYKTTFFKKITNGLRYCGKMSLTAYVLQSIVGSFVFYNYGLGLGPKISTSISLLVGVALFIGQVYFYKFWIKKFKQGPLEKLWHKLTWIKL